MQLGNGVIPGKDRVCPVLERAGAPNQHHDADDDPWQQCAPKLGLRQRRLVDGLCRHHRGGRLVPAGQRRRQPEFPGLPDLEEEDETAHRDQRCTDIDDPWIDVVRDQELRNRERNAGDEDGRPDRRHPAPPRECPDQPERHDQRENRQLAADHRAENIGIETGHRSETLDRRTQRAISDRGGIGDQGQAGSRQRRETETDQDCAGDRDRRSEAGCALEKCAERKRDQQQLQAAVGGDAADGALQQLEPSGLDRNTVEENDVEHDPADGEEADHHAEQRCLYRHGGRHGVYENRDDVGGDQRDDSREVRLHPAAGNQHQKRNHRKCGGDRRQRRIAERIIDLSPHYSFSPTPPLLRADQRARSGVPGVIARCVFAMREISREFGFTKLRSQPREVRKGPAPSPLYPC